jgi:hypothetical protein
VDPVPSENLVAPGIEAGISGSIARNSDHWTTEAVCKTKPTKFNLIQF